MVTIVWVWIGSHADFEASPVRSLVDDPKDSCPSWQIDVAHSDASRRRGALENKSAYTENWLRPAFNGERTSSVSCSARPKRRGGLCRHHLHGKRPRGRS